MSAPEHCNCGAEDCPRCDPLNRKQSAVTERDRADALTDIAEDALVFDAATAAGIRDQAAEVGRLIGGLIRRCAGGG